MMEAFPLDATTEALIDVLELIVKEVLRSCIFTATVFARFNPVIFKSELVVP
jgi:hypothetical protein